MLKKIFFVSVLTTSLLTLNSCGMGKLISVKPMDSQGVKNLEVGYLAKVENTFTLMQNPNEYLTSGAFDAFSNSELKNIEKIEKFYSSSETTERRKKIAEIVAASVPDLKSIVIAKINNFTAVDHAQLINGNLSSYLKPKLYNEMLKSAQNTVDNSNLNFNTNHSNTIIASNDLLKIEKFNASIKRNALAEQIVNSFFGILSQQK